MVWTPISMASPPRAGNLTICGRIRRPTRLFPLGTYVKVTNLENGRSAILRINDRGPFVAGRIIDLSAKGAEDLGCRTKGLARVRVEAVQCATAQVVGNATYWKVDPVPSFRYGRFTVQIGAFRDQANAYRLKEKMSRRKPGKQSYESA